MKQTPDDTPTHSGPALVMTCTRVDDRLVVRIHKDARPELLDALIEGLADLAARRGHRPVLDKGALH